MKNDKRPFDDGQLRSLSRAEVLDRIGVTYPCLWAWMQKGQFPRARELGASRIGWLSSEIDDWMRNRPMRKLKGDAA